MSDTHENTWVVNTTAATFERDVLGRSVELPVVVDFWAPWCAPCRALGPVLEKLASEMDGRFLLVKANTDEMQEAAAQFNVQGIPAVFAVVNQEVIDYFSGAVPEPMLRQWLDRALAAGAMLDAKRVEEVSASAAEVKYRAILASDPKNTDVQIALARTLLAQDRAEEARVLVTELERRGFLEPEAQKLKAALDLKKMEMSGGDVENRRRAAQADPNNLQLQFQLAESLAGTKSFEEALEILLTLVQRDRKGIGELARKLMVEIFQALPDDSELTTQYRRKLSMALY